MSRSIFQRPMSVPPTRMTVAESTYRTVVTDEADLRAAITAFASRTPTQPVRPSLFLRQNNGAQIVVSGTIEIADTILIPSTCIGLEITSIGSSALIPKTFLTTMFEIRAPQVTLSNLRCFSRLVGGAVTLSVAKFVNISDEDLETGLHADWVTIRDCYAEAPQLVTADGASDLQILNCGKDFTSPSWPDGSIVLVDCEHPLILGNSMFNGSGGNGIILGADCSDGRIIGNHLVLNGIIDTTASNGSNVVTGNTETSLSLDGSDSAAANT